jgi:hypothetical protein
MAKFDTTGVRLIYATRGETSGHQSFPIRPMAMVGGRPMLGGLKLLLDGSGSFQIPMTGACPRF